MLLIWGNECVYIYGFIHRRLYNKSVYSMHCNIIMIISVFLFKSQISFCFEILLMYFPCARYGYCCTQYTWIHNNDITFLQVIYKAWHIQAGVCTVRVCVCVFICVCVILCTCACFSLWIYKSFLALCWPGWSYLGSVSYKMSNDEWEEFTDDLSVSSCVSLSAQ